MTKRQKQKERNIVNNLDMLIKLKKLTPYQRLYLDEKLYGYYSWRHFKYNVFYYEPNSFKKLPSAFAAAYYKAVNFCKKQGIYIPDEKETVGKYSREDIFRIGDYYIEIYKINIKDSTLINVQISAIKHKIADIKRKKRELEIEIKRQEEIKKAAAEKKKLEAEVKKQKRKLDKCDGKIVEIDGAKFILKKV